MRQVTKGLFFLGILVVEAQARPKFANQSPERSQIPMRNRLQTLKSAFPSYSLRIPIKLTKFKKNKKKLDETVNKAH